MKLAKLKPAKRLFIKESSLRGETAFLAKIREGGKGNVTDAWIIEASKKERNGEAETEETASLGLRYRAQLFPVIVADDIVGQSSYWTVQQYRKYDTGLSSRSNPKQFSLAFSLRCFYGHLIAISSKLGHTMPYLRHPNRHSSLSSDPTFPSFVPYIRFMFCVIIRGLPTVLVQPMLQLYDQYQFVSTQTMLDGLKEIE